MNSEKVVEYLIGELLPFAKKMLLENGEFHPFGGWITAEGKMVHAGAKSPSTDNPKALELMKILQDEIQARAKSGEIQAAGIVFDVRVFVKKIEEKSDAIQLNLDHCDGYSAEVFLPYRKEEHGKLIFGEIFSQAGKSEIFLNK